MERAITTTLEGEVTAEKIGDIKKKLSFSMLKGDYIKVCCKNIYKTDIAGFNAMVIAHMTAIRANKQLRFINCSEAKLVDFISQTQFNHVFITH